MNNVLWTFLLWSHA